MTLEWNAPAQSSYEGGKKKCGVVGSKPLCLLEPWLSISSECPRLTRIPGPVWVTLTTNYFIFSEKGVCWSDTDHWAWCSQIHMDHSFHVFTCLDSHFWESSGGSKTCQRAMRLDILLDHSHLWMIQKYWVIRVF